MVTEKPKRKIADILGILFLLFILTLMNELSAYVVCVWVIGANFSHLYIYLYAVIVALLQIKYLFKDFYNCIILRNTDESIISDIYIGTIGLMFIAHLIVLLLSGIIEFNFFSFLFDSMNSFL